MEAIPALTQLREMARSKVLPAAPRIRPLDLTLFLAIPLAVIPRRLVLAHSVATRLAVIIRPMDLVLCFLIQLAPTTPQLVLKCYLPTSTGFENAGTGSRALFANTTGFHNTADGFSALVRN